MAEAPAPSNITLVVLPMGNVEVFSISINDVPVTLCGVTRVRRQKGQVTQWCDIYIGRACYRGGWELPQSKWYNRFTVK